MEDDSLVPHSQTHLLVVIPVVCLAVLFAFAWNPWEGLKPRPKLQGFERSAGLDRYLSMKAMEYSDKELKDVQEKQDGCLGCHNEADKLEKVFKDKKKAAAWVDLAKFRASPHGKSLACHSCHEGYEKFFDAGEHDFFDGTYEAFKAKAAGTCAACHATNAADLKSSAHGTKGGLTCVSCHGFHEITGAGQEGTWAGSACKGCHDQLVSEYERNVHALARKKGVKDSPGCTDCHGSTHVLAPVGKGRDSWAGSFARTACSECHAKKGPDLGKAHDFLVPVDLHLGRKAGCACHVAKTKGVHILGEGNQPVSGKNKKEICSMCHTPDGSLAKAVDADYVIGSTRHRWLDIVGLAVIAATFAGLPLGHGGLRLLAGMMRKAKH